MQPVVGCRYTWKEVEKNWHGEQTYLAKRDGRIVCATLVKESNPEAPEVMIVGSKPRNMQRAEEFCEQGGSIPMFIKHAVNQWEFMGHYELVSFATDRDTLRRHERVAGSRLTRVMFMRRVDEAAGEAATDRELDELPSVGIENRKHWRLHLQRERSRTMVSAKKCDVRRRTGKLACEACELEFGAEYGPQLEEFCEVHHRIPLGRDSEQRETRLEDLAVLCANCHRAIHRLGPPMPSVEALASVISERRKKSQRRRLSR
jgi:predicted HNH restriction endonuclease